MLALRLFDSARDFLAEHLPIHPSSPWTNPVPSSHRDALLAVRLHAACLSPSSSIAHLPPDAMRRELDHAKSELARSNDELARLYERCRLLERSVRESRDSLKAKDSEIEKLRRDRDRERALADRRRTDTTSGRDLYKSPSTNGLAHQHHHHSSSSTHSIPDSDTASLSSGSVADEERARARTADAYLTRTDTWSGAQVLQAVHDINSEILQFAAAATEMCTFDRASRPSSSRSIQAMHDTSARIGHNLARILSNRDHSQDPILVQLALQGCLTLCVTRALSSFCVGFPSKSDTLLQQIYHRMALAEPQPTSSKWRALTHQHIHAMYPSLVEYSINELTETILRWSSDIFLIAGCPTYEAPSTSLSTSSISASASASSGLKARFGEHVRQLSKSTIRLAKVIREEILSTSFELVAIDPTTTTTTSNTTTTNNSSAASTTSTNSATNTTTTNGSSSNGPMYHERTMIDAFGEYGHSRGAVLATTELGLRCVTRMGTREGVGSEEEVLLEQRVLLMPKVVLESVLDVLDR